MQYFIFFWLLKIKKLSESWNPVTNIGALAFIEGLIKFRKLNFLNLRMGYFYLILY